jgi:hypothetical protein
MPLPTRASAIRLGTHNVFGCIKELVGAGTNIVSAPKNDAKGSSIIFSCIFFAIDSDIKIGGVPINPSFFRRYIAFLERCASSELPRGV